jgi:hypothetical protein
MRRTRFIPALVGACLAAGTACSDTVAPTVAPTGETGSSPPLTPQLITLTGVIHLSETTSRYTAALDIGDGPEITLDGADFSSFAAVDRVEIEVRGNWLADRVFEVSDFVVQSVEGTPALDGILVAVEEDQTDEKSGSITVYALQLTRGGSVTLTDPPADLIAHLGQRLWVIASPDGPPTAFGTITETK